MEPEVELNIFERFRENLPDLLNKAEDLEAKFWKNVENGSKETKPKMDFLIEAGLNSLRGILNLRVNIHRYLSKHKLAGLQESARTEFELIGEQIEESGLKTDSEGNIIVSVEWFRLDKIFCPEKTHLPSLEHSLAEKTMMT